MTNLAQPKWMTWTGRALTVLVAALLVFSGIMKFTNSPELLEGLAKMGYAQALIQKIGVVELVCTAIYLIPQTTVLGAILLTGYLGGATATHVRIGDPFIMPVVVGVVAWLGVFFREPRVRALIPGVRSRTTPPLM